MLARTDAVDMILRDPKTGGVELVCGVEAGEWDAPGALELLKSKLDGYAHFALDGEMHGRFPDLKGKPTTLTVVSVDPVPPLFQKWLDAIGRVFEGEGLRLEVKRVQIDQAA